MTEDLQRYDDGSLQPSEKAYFEGLVQQFLSEDDVRQDTRNTYRAWLKRYTDWAGENNISIGHAKRQDLLDYKKFLSDKNLSKVEKSTASSLLVAVRKLYSWFHSKGYYPVNIGLGIKYPKLDKKFKRKGLTPDEVGNLLDW